MFWIFFYRMDKTSNSVKLRCYDNAFYVCMTWRDTFLVIHVIPFVNDSNRSTV